MSKRVFITKSISIDPELAKEAIERADELRMNFSEYVSRCLESDIARKGKPFLVVPSSGKSRNTVQRHKKK